MDYLRGRKKHGWGRGWFLTRSLISTRIRKHENLIIFQICFFYDFRAEEVLAKKGVQDLWHGKVLKSGSHSLKHEFQNSISSTYPDFQRNVFGRLVHTSQDGAEQHFPKYSLGNLRCTSRKGPCGQLIWVNLFFKISHLRIYYAHEHFNIPLPHKSIVHSALLLCFHVEGNQFLASWGGGVLGHVSCLCQWICSHVIYTLSKQKLQMGLNNLGQPLCSCPVLWGHCGSSKGLVLQSSRTH